MKRRKKEFGVFNILGMEKRHIVYVIACETVLSAGLALSGGIGLGIGIERVLYALLSMMAQGTLPLGVYIGIGSIRSTCLLFVVIFVLIFLNSIRQIHLDVYKRQDGHRSSSVRRKTAIASPLKAAPF